MIIIIITDDFSLWSLQLQSIKLVTIVLTIRAVPCDCPGVHGGCASCLQFARAIVTCWVCSALKTEYSSCICYFVHHKCNIVVHMQLINVMGMVFVIWGAYSWLLLQIAQNGACSLSMFTRIVSLAFCKFMSSIVIAFAVEVHCGYFCKLMEISPIAFCNSQRSLQLFLQACSCDCTCVFLDL